MTAIGSGAAMGDWRTAAEKRLERFVANVVPGYPGRLDTRVTADSPTPALLHDEARRWGATLIVLAADVHGFFRSEAERMVHDFEIPVLVIPRVRS